MKVYRIHWTVHPEKDYEWYMDQRSRMSDDEAARELDINYALSVSGRVFSSFNRAKHVTNNFNPKKAFPIIRIWDFGHTNAVLYMQIDEMNRKYVWHERILGKIDEGEPASDTVEMAQQAMVDSRDFFEGFSFIDVCDPQGKVNEQTGMSSSHVEVLNKEFQIYPSYGIIDATSKRGRKQRCVQMVQRDLQYAPGGREAFQLYVSDDTDQPPGCPVLQKAFESAYRLKKDAAGNYTDQIMERHPYEDVMDCLFYGYLEEGVSAGEAEKDLYRPEFDDTVVNSYLGY